MENGPSRRAVFIIMRWGWGRASGVGLHLHSNLMLSYLTLICTRTHAWYVKDWRWSFHWTMKAIFIGKWSINGYFSVARFEWLLEGAEVFVGRFLPLHTTTSWRNRAGRVLLIASSNWSRMAEVITVTQQHLPMRPTGTFWQVQGRMRRTNLNFLKVQVWKKCSYMFIPWILVLRYQQSKGNLVELSSTGLHWNSHILWPKVEVEVALSIVKDTFHGLNGHFMTDC